MSSTACCGRPPTAACSTTTSATCSATRSEHERYAAGRERLTVEWKGWRICPLVCYDLRFPVYSRNRFDVERTGALDYDLLLYVANWPSARAYAVEDAAARARDREPVLRRRPQPRRHATATACTTPATAR